MDPVGDALDYLAGLPRPAVVAAAGVLAFSETAIGFGFVLPGETGVLVLATTATTVPMFILMSVVVWLSASAGDSFGYWLGRRYGVRVRRTRLVVKVGQSKWDRAADLLHRYGMVAVIGARFLPGVRVLVPAAAGSVRLGYPRFLVASLTGAFVWAVLHVAVGAFAGASLRRIEHFVGTAGWVALATAVIIATLVHMIRRRRRQQRSETDEPDG